MVKKLSMRPDQVPLGSEMIRTRVGSLSPPRGGIGCQWKHSATEIQTLRGARLQRDRKSVGGAKAHSANAALRMIILA